jgi:prepilin-type N-terminal cleavage/methylation domain-containing protein
MPLRRADDESGFTLIEIMVAIAVLLVGVLGVVTLVNVADAQTVNTRAREGATNLAREIVEVTRDLPYYNLDNTNLIPAPGGLQGQPGLADASAAPGWQIRRRGITFTVRAPACELDSARDGVRAAGAPGTFCAGSPNAGSGATTDLNPDDQRVVEVTITWPSRKGVAPSCSGTGGGSGEFCVTQTALVPNPTGGLGPSVLNIAHTPIDPIEDSTPSGSGNLTVHFTFDTTSTAETATWTADDAISTGAATPQAGDTTGLHWQFDWIVPANDTDGTYAVTIQAFVLSVGGQPAPTTVVINRFVPSPPNVDFTPNKAAGVNTRLCDTVLCPGGSLTGTKGPVVEINWKPNPERDVIGYRVFRMLGALPTLSGTADPEVCHTLPSKTSCFDTSPVATGTNNYYVVAFDKPWTSRSFDPAVYTTCGAATAYLQLVGVPQVALFNGNERPGCPSVVIPVDMAAGYANPAPQWSGSPGLTITSPGGIPHLVWNTQATDTVQGAGPGTLLYYRIYRDGTPIASNGPKLQNTDIDGNSGVKDERYDATSSGAAISYDDQNPLSSATTHTYAVTAVDTQYNESAPIEASWP